MRVFVLVLGTALGAPSAAQAEPSGFDELLGSARRALKSKDLDTALEQCRAAGEASGEPKEGGPKRSAAALMCGDVELARSRYGRAARYFRNAAHFAIDDRRIRHRALSRRKRALTLAKNRGAASTVAKLIVHDQRVRVLERYPRRSKQKAEQALRDLDRIADAYRADRDRSRVDLTKAVRALVMARSGRPEDGAAAADRLVTDARTARARSIAAQARYYGLSVGEDDEAVLDAAIRYNQMVADDVAPDKRAHLRTPELAAACRRFEKAKDPGSCARRQLAIAKTVWLTNFSRERRRSGPLSTTDLERVHHEALPWLERCVLDAARADPERFSGTDLTIAWAVGADGVPRDVSVKPSRYAGDLGGCLTNVVGQFRYPRVRSQELSTVSVPYRLD